MPRGPNTSQAPSRRSTPSRTRAVTRDPSKVITACLTCRQRKVKCSGTNPCSYCSKRGLDCSFSEHGKRRAYSVARIEYLEARLASYENGTPVLSPVSQTDEAVRPPLEDIHPSTRTPAPSRTRRSSIRIGNNSFLVDSLGLPPTGSHPELEENATTCASEPSPGSAIAADSSLSSSYAFGSRVQSLLDGSRSAPRRDYAALTTDQLLLQPQPRTTHVFDIPSLPTEQEAFGLLETLVTYIGHTQNYVDAREISDKIGLLYANKQDTTNAESLWTLEILLICAIARLFKGDFGGDEHRTDPYPGYVLFDFVRDRIPPLGQLYRVGRVGVEVLALVAVYLQNIYCKEEAYVYISTALRLAVSHGYHRQSITGRFLQSEATHINRLWWSIYSQERRIAAATGSPQGISDSVIEQPLPTDSIGFTPAAPMRTSIKLARVYGQIMTVLYGSTLQTEDTFISNVQSIIRSLYDISDEIPLELTTGMPKLGHELSLRTSAALHLMFYQALLLTIRPVMLHIAQLILTGKTPQPGILYSSPLGKLCRTCTEAARRLLKVLMTLRQHNCIALFGFFDFDGIFSVTFIMILTAILDSACKDPAQQIHPAPGLAEALDLIQYVANSHNTFADQWLREIRGTWAQLCTRLDMPEGYRAIERRLGVLAGARSRPRSRPRESSTGYRGNGSPLDTAESVNASSLFPARAGPVRSSGGSGSGSGSAAYEENTTPVRSGDTVEAEFLNGDSAAVPDVGGGAPDPQSQSILADLDVWGDINHLWAPLPEDWGEVFQSQSQNQDENDDGAANAIPQSLYQNIYGSREWTFTGEDMGDFAELGRQVGGASL